MSVESLTIDSIIVALVAGLFSIAAWISATRARREQTQLTREQTEAEAYGRAQGIYTTALKTLEDQLKAANDRIAEQNRRIHDLEETLDNRGLFSPSEVTSAGGTGSRSLSLRSQAPGR